ncbi:MAG TPA: GNAT family N-acetyltransferase [Vicinamibacterales bacterium]|nr:GNAT family N-acetyltransferase [Vicinamibacterales bacterium]
MAPITIIPFQPQFAEAFERLNRAWIEQFFKVEESDLRMLTDPQSSILAGGGQIFFALNDGTAVGTVAAVCKSDTVFELAKMAVSPAVQGRGIGERLGRAAIAYAREAGASMMFLETNSALQNAIRLYERLGFAHATRRHPSPYERSNVYMELRFDRP